MTEGYILNTVQTPGPLRTVYDSIDRGNTTEEEIANDTDLPEDLRSQGMRGLQELGMIGREEPDYYTAGFAWETGNRDLDFRMTALHNLAIEATPGEWGKQSVVLLNYQYLLQEDIQHLHASDQVLYEAIDKWEHEQREYRPRSQQGPITLNEPKFVNWTRLADFLGLIEKATGREYVVYPDPEMILESLRIATGDEKRIAIQEYINWLQENLLLINLTGERDVPAPFARTLYNLIREEKIKLVEYGDAGVVRLDRSPRRSGMEKDANSIEVIA